MEDASPSKSARKHRSPRRSRSRSQDSEEERRSRRRRRERDDDYEGKSRRARDDSPHGKSRDKRYRDESRERHRRRHPSRDGDDRGRRRHRDYDSKHKSRRSRSRSPRKDDKYRTSLRDKDMQVTRRKDGPLPSQEASFTMAKDPTGAQSQVAKAGEGEKEKPNFAPTGVLAAASNTVSQADGTSIVLKYHEPPEARKPPPRDQWKLFVFKGADIVDTIELSTRSCWLIGRELSVVDMPAEHPSISKQHAVIQFRYVEKKNEFGDKLGKVKPYLIDLESANGTSLNKDPVPASRYLELRDKDMIQFGHSTREYVLMLPPRD